MSEPHADPTRAARPAGGSGEPPRRWWQRGERAGGNPFGLVEAVVGLLGGFLLSVLAIAAYASARHLRSGSTSYGTDVLGLVVLWVGLVAAVVAATILNSPQRGGRGTGSVVSDFGLRFRPIDLPLGVAVGIASQLLLVPVLEAPLQPFVPHLAQKLGHPTTQLLGTVSGPGLVVLTILVCVGSPVVEELFFRGLLLRALLGRLEPLGRRLGPVVSVALTGIVFGLVHFESLQFLGLAGFGIVLGALAYRTGRLGPSMVAHVAFNSTTVIWYVAHH